MTNLKQFLVLPVLLACPFAGNPAAEAAEDTGYLDAYLNAEKTDPLGGANSGADGEASDGSGSSSGITPAGPNEGPQEGEEGNAAQAYSNDSWIDEVLDPVWTLPLLYENQHNPYIQGAFLTGRFAWQTGDVNADSGDIKDSELRRALIGTHLRMFYSIDIDAVFQFDDATGDGFSYDGVDEAWVTWHLSDNFRARIGKMRARWSHEWKTEHHDLMTFERSQLVNQLHPEKTSGIYLNGEWEQWNYGVGVHSGKRDRRGLGSYNFSDRRFWVFNVGYEFIDPEAPDTIENWYLDYIYNEDDEKNRALPRFQHLIATGVTVESDRTHFLAEVIYANGESNVWGVILQPSYFVIPQRLQLVARYTYADSDDSNALIFNDRYASRSPGITDMGRGDEFHSMYLGLNYYVYGNNIKLMTGIEYSMMRETDGNEGEYKGWSWLTGARISF